MDESFPGIATKDMTKTQLLYGRLIAIRYLLLESLKLIGTYVLSLFYKSRDLWLICDRGDDASDNGYFFFLWLKEHHPEKTVKFIISKDSPEYAKMMNYEDDLVINRSLKHYILFHKSDCLIGSQLNYCYPCPDQMRIMTNRMHLFRGKKRIYLKHGIIKDYYPLIHYSKNKVDMVCSAARQEDLFLKNVCNYPDKIVKQTGLCRYDSLKRIPSRDILIMPTWRMYLTPDSFLTSDYFKAYHDLLTNPLLYSLLESEDLNLFFFPHYKMQPFLKHFKAACSGSRIKIADRSYDIQTLLNRCLVLITDYSSIIFDVAYLHKPLICYQFDRPRFFSDHHSSGYFNDETGFGPLVETESDLMRELEKTISNGFRMEDVYKNRVDDFFIWRDNNNCKRVYDAIQSIK